MPQHWRRRRGVLFLVLDSSRRTGIEGLRVEFTLEDAAEICKRIKLCDWLGAVANARRVL